MDAAIRRLRTRRLRGSIRRVLTTMATEVLLPKIGFTMTEGEINEWLVADGQAVAEGQPLFVLEADKATNEVEAPASGTLRILKAAQEGPHEVGTVIGVIE
jgi:pyruvate/2-oxoglutarate dehydrogenase complex dihydrolipoamide acyltransferase (E2) component